MQTCSKAHPAQVLCEVPPSLELRQALGLPQVERSPSSVWWGLQSTGRAPAPDLPRR